MVVLQPRFCNSDELQCILTLLPEEILEELFIRIDDLDTLLQCRRLCKLVKGVVDNSVRLQYHVGLLAAGYTDTAGTSGPAAADRLRTLRSHLKGWRNLTPKRRVSIPVGTLANIYELADGIFVQVGDGAGKQMDTVRYLTLPSRETSEYSWELQRMPFTIADLAIDRARDLVVFIECDLRDEQFIIHPRTISDGGIHPESCGRIEAPFADGAMDYSFIIQVCDRHVGVLFLNKSGAARQKDRFMLWDWHSGKLRADMSPQPTESWETFVFLSHNLFLLPNLVNNSLDTYEFDSEDDNSPIRKRASFCLPRIQNEVRLSRVVARAEPAPSSTLSRSLPFAAQAESAVIVLTMTYTVPVGVHPTLVDAPPGWRVNVTRRHTFVVRRSALTLPEFRDTVPWSEWGPRWTRWGLDLAPPRWVCYTHGARYATLAQVPETAPPGTTILSVYDFNFAFPPDPTGQAAVHDETAEPPVFGPADSRVVRRTDVNTNTSGKLFAEEVTSMTPFRSVCAHVLGEWDSVMIDGDRIIGLVTSEWVGAPNSCSDRIEVLVL